MPIYRHDAVGNIVFLLLIASFSDILGFELNDGKGRPYGGHILYSSGRNNYQQLGLNNRLIQRPDGMMQSNAFGPVTPLDSSIQLTDRPFDSSDVSVPNVVDTGYIRLQKLYAGGDYAYALSEDGTKLYSWGRNDMGQLGRGSFTQQPQVFGHASRFAASDLAIMLQFEVGQQHNIASFGPKAGSSFRYESFGRISSSFQYNGDARQEYLMKSACPPCMNWKDTPFRDNPNMIESVCSLPNPETPTAQGTARAAKGQPWCYVGQNATRPCVDAIEEVWEAKKWWYVECVDNGKLLVSGDPPDRLQKGSVWRKERVNVYQAFETTFSFSISNSDTKYGGGDGLVLMFQNSSINALGGTGNDLGAAKGQRRDTLGGIPNSVGIEIDTFDDEGIEVRGCFGGPYTYDDTAKVCTLGSKRMSLSSVKDGNRHELKIQYAPFTLEVFLDLVRVLRIPFNIEEHVKTGDAKSYVGFTASTGAAMSTHRVEAWRFQSLSQQGSLRSTGSNDYGQLGLTDVTDRFEPNLIKSLEGEVIIDSSLGAKHSVALSDQGQVYVWGGNQFGQLGQGNFESQNVPTKVRRIAIVQDANGGCPQIGVVRDRTPDYGCASRVAAGAHYTIVVVDIRKAGVIKQTLYGFGDNTYGQQGVILDSSDLGHSPLLEEDWRILNLPFRLAAFVGDQPFGYIQQVECGDFHTVALTNNDELIVWGLNLRGQLGTGTTRNSETPINIRDKIPSAAGTTIRKFSVGGFHTVVLMSDGSVYTWGSNYFGQLGQGIEARQSLKHLTVPVNDRRVRLLPTRISKFQTQNRNILDISAGRHFTIFLADCSGYGFDGEGNCNCQFGNKGHDCALRCMQGTSATACFKNGQFLYNATAESCTGSLQSVSAPCTLRGTFDREERRFSNRDLNYDCEVDGSCTCRLGFQDVNCEIECRQTETNRFKPAIGTRLNCECEDGYSGILCDQTLGGGAAVAAEGEGDAAMHSVRPSLFLIVITALAAALIMKLN